MKRRILMAAALAVSLFAGGTLAQELPPKGWAPEGSPVAQHGRLKIVGNKVKSDKTDTDVQLRGMSFSWTSDITSGIAPRNFYTERVVAWLTADWKVSLVRAAMGVSDKGGSYNGPHLAPGQPYKGSENTHKNIVNTVVRAAIWQGIYVIIDWHSHQADVGATEKPEAIAFFREMAEMYKDYPNVIYEIFNEPLGNQNNRGQTWTSITSNYALAVIDAIRAVDPNNIIIVGTPFYSQVEGATAITGTNRGNLAYALHFYCDHSFSPGTTLPLFVSEFGLSHSSGNGVCPSQGSILSGSTYNPQYMKTWFDFMDNNKLSWANWSISNRDESASALKAPNKGGRDATVLARGNWVDSDLTESGMAMRTRLRSYSSGANRTYNIKVTAKGQGTVSGNSNIAVCAETNLTATPAGGWRFEGWVLNGARIKDNPYKFDVCYDREGEAVFFQNNLLTNSTFTIDQTGWSATGTGVVIEPVNGEGKVTVAANSSADGRLQQQNVRLENGKKYKLTFDARAVSGTRTITPAFRGGGLSVEWVQAAPVTLTATMQPFSAVFNMNSPTATNAIIAFNCGGQAGDWIIDNVSLVEDGASSAVPQAVPAAPFRAVFNGHALTLTGAAGKRADVTVFDMAGRVRMSRSVPLSGGSALVTLDRLPAGVYSVRYAVDGKAAGANGRIVLAR